MLGYNFWRERFAGDESIVGKDITVNGQNYAVVGITPQGFRGTDVLGGSAPLYFPLMTYKQTLQGSFREWFEERRPLSSKRDRRVSSPE